MTARRELLFWLAGLLVAALVLFVLRSILLPFVAGLGVAYLLDPLVDRLEAWGLSRTLATSVVTAVFFALVIALAILLFPVVQGQVLGFVERLPAYVRAVQEAAAPIADRLVSALSIEAGQDVREALPGLVDGAAGWVGHLIARLWSGGIAFFNVLSLIFITPVVTFYLLRDWDHLVARVDGWLPRQHADVVREQLGLIDAALAGFLRGQALVCLSLGVFYAAALSLIGLDFGLVIGLLGGILAFIPYVGAIVTLAVSLLFAFLQFWPDLTPIVLVVAIFAVGQAVEGNFLSPWLVGQRVGLHPVWIIFSLLAGGALFGFIGVLIAVPAAAVLGVLARFLLHRYQTSRVFLGPGGAASGGPPEP